MAIHYAHLRLHLTNSNIQYIHPDERKAICVIYATKAYRDNDGQHELKIYIELDENGRYIKIMAPLAYHVPKEMAPHFLMACAMIQWRTKLIQFEYDARDGEVRPLVEFPLEDNDLTAKQLTRCIVGLVELIDRYYPVLERVMHTNEIAFPIESDPTAKSIFATPVFKVG